MEAIDALHLQMRLEGIGLGQDNRMFQITPANDSIPLALVARLTWGSTVVYFRKSLQTDLLQELAGSGNEGEFPNVDFIGKVFQTFGFQTRVEHFRTYVFPEGYSLWNDTRVKPFPKEDPKVKAFGFGGFADRVYAVEENGVIISACVSALQNAECAEAWVMTAPEHRQRGLAQSVVAAWARGMLEQGLIPFYSHKVENLASAQLALKLGLISVYQELVVEEKQEG